MITTTTTTTTTTTSSITTTCLSRRCCCCCNNPSILEEQQKQQQPLLLNHHCHHRLLRHQHQRFFVIPNIIVFVVTMFNIMLLYQRTTAFTITTSSTTTVRQYHPKIRKCLQRLVLTPTHQNHHQQQQQQRWYSSGRHNTHHYYNTQLYSTAKKGDETEEISSTIVQQQPQPQQQQPQQRLSAQGLSLDIKTITNHYDIVLSHMMSRNPTNNSIAITAIRQIANQSQQRSSLIQQRDTALNERRTLSDQIGLLLRQQKEWLSKYNTTHEDIESLDDTTTTETSTETASTLKEQYQQLVQELEQKMNDSNRVAAIAEQTETELDILQNDMDEQLSILPNLLDDQVPTGRDESDNEIVYTHGDIYTLPQRLGWPMKYCCSEQDNSNVVDKKHDDTDNDWKPGWHDDIATRVSGYMSDAAVQMSGSRFIALRAEIAQLERAIGQWMLDLHTSQSGHNYIEVSVPYIVSRSTLVGTGQLPKFEDDLFAITPTSHTCNGEDAFLIPTAEVPITNLHRNEVLNEEDLPISYVALTPCFRAEAGSYGRDTKGLIRTHQFHKVELVKITSATTSQEQHELLTSHAETCLQLLELPYRKVRLCSGDIGFSANHCYDLEVYLPGSQEYREISSCSNTGDFQSRRLALRYRPKPIETKTNGGSAKKKSGGKLKPILCHTINGSGLAVGRTLVAILENYQCPDGSIVIPDVLRPYMRGKEIIVIPSTTTTTSSSSST